VLDFTTAFPESSRSIATTLGSVGIDFIDTPMTGGPRQADEGKIKLVVGGRQEVVERYRGLLEKVSERVVHVGESGSGNAVKLANNFLSILNRASGAAVAILLAKMDIPLDKVHEFISVSGGNSNGFQSVMRNILQDDYSVNFALELAYKDLRYGQQLFKQIGGFPIMDAVVDEYRRADEAGYGKRDVGAIFLSLSERLGS
jgi:3-hydroxyisobutyrate dehydrogenase-like beta-hydroxyacid dehydrogenase